MQQWQVALLSSIGTACFVLVCQVLLNKKSSDTHNVKIRYSKIIILLALTVMTAIFVADVILCWRSGQQLDSSSVVAMSGFWGTEVFASAWIKVTESKNSNKSDSIKVSPSETTPSGEPYTGP